MPISPIGSGAPLPFVSPAKPTVGADATGFAEQVSQGLDSLQQVQGKADSLATQAATGDLTDVHDYVIAAQKASLATELTVAVRNRAVEAFNEVMRMQV